MIKIYTDGASRGNPGNSAISVVIIENNQILKEFSERIGIATNNIAEYKAIIKALELGKKYSSEIEITSDSLLVISQIRGDYKINKPHLLKLFEKVKENEKKFQQVKYHHVKRDNQFISRADYLVNQCLNEKV